MDKTKSNSPFLLATGEDELHIKQYEIIVEKMVLLSVNRFSKALVCLIGAYYVFDMAYPRECKNSLLFLEKFLLKLPSSEKMSASVIAALTDYTR